MATTIRTPIGSLTIDNLRFDDASTGLDIFNKIPEDGETRVLTAANLSFWLAAYSGVLAAASVKVWLSIPGTVSRVLIYDGSAGGFQTGYTGTATYQASPNSGVVDELIFSVNPDVDLAGETLYKLEVQAQVGADILNAAYTFTTAAVLPPCVDEMLWIDPRRVRARWREEMQDDVGVEGTRYLVDLTGAMEFIAPDKLLVLGPTLTADWIGYWLGTTGSAFPQNNGYFEILSIDTTLQQITVDTRSVVFKTDDGLDKDDDGNLVRKRILRGTITSYRFEPRPQDELPEIVCAYAPVVTALTQPTVDQIPSGANIKQYVIVDLHDDISISRMYRMHCARALNDAGIAAAAASTFNFTSPSFGSPGDRIDLWSLFPEADKDEDLLAEGQLRRMACVLQDALNLLWHRCDTLLTINDPDTCPRQWVDHLLYTMGNPFVFPLTELEKRRLIAVLVGIYKRVGTKQVIEDTLAFFTGITFQCQAFHGANYWQLGTSVLHVTTVLGPSSAYAKNAYEIISPVALTADQRRQVREIAEYLDPVYMHLIRIVEPGETPGTLQFWVLGQSSLGFTAQLAP